MISPMTANRYRSIAKFVGKGAGKLVKSANITPLVVGAVCIGVVQFAIIAALKKASEIENEQKEAAARKDAEELAEAAADLTNVKAAGAEEKAPGTETAESENSGEEKPEE